MTTSMGRTVASSRRWSSKTDRSSGSTPWYLSHAAAERPESLSECPHTSYRCGKRSLSIVAIIIASRCQSRARTQVSTLATVHVTILRTRRCLDEGAGHTQRPRAQGLASTNTFRGWDKLVTPSCCAREGTWRAYASGGSSGSLYGSTELERCRRMSRIIATPAFVDGRASATVRAVAMRRETSASLQLSPPRASDRGCATRPSSVSSA